MIGDRTGSSQDLLALTVLALLSEQPRHPYDVQRLIRERHKDFAMGKSRALYHAVDRLMAQGLIEPLETSREGKRPERTVYRITEDGREEFTAWLADLLENPRQEHPAFTAAVSFLCYLSMPAALNALQSRVVALQSQLAALDTAIRALQTQLGLPRLFILEHECTRALCLAELDWTRSLVANIQGGRLAWDPEDWDALFRGSTPGQPSAASSAHLA